MIEQHISTPLTSIKQRIDHDDTNSHEEGQILLVVLKIGEEQYGIPIQHVEEIQSFIQCTPLPGTSPFWSGIVNLRGRLYALLDLAKYLHIAPDYKLEERKIAFVQARGLEVGLLIDDVLKVRRILPTDISSSLIHSRRIHREAIRGLTTDLLSVLDLEVLLSDPKLITQDQIN